MDRARAVRGTSEPRRGARRTAVPLRRSEEPTALKLQRQGEGREAGVGPRLRRGDEGPEVERLQRLINDFSVRGMLVADGIFGRRTNHYVRAIQGSADLPETGVVTPETWRAIREGAAPGDLLSGVSEGGQYPEIVGGVRYVGDRGYAMEVTDRQVRITVGIDFVGARAPATLHRWIRGLVNIWNRFAAHDTATGRTLPIIFEPDTGGSAHHTVTVHRGAGRSDEANWFTGDPGMPYGLERREVAEQVAIAHDSDGTPLERIEAIQAVLDRWHVTDQGQYPAAVAAAYEEGAGHPLLDDLVALGQAAPSDSRGAYDLIETFTYSSQTIMGNMGMDHEHAARPHHVAGFVDYVQEVVGGWSLGADLEMSRGRSA